MPTAKKRTKHDPKKLFTVITVSRSDIASQLNAAIAMTGTDIAEFEDNDPRLTDKVCQDLADKLYDAYCNGADDAMDEAEHVMYVDSLEQFEEG